MTAGPGRRRVVILGAAGRDFHDFNVVFRDDASVEVVAFTAAQIPGIAGRRYPPSLAGPLYPEGIPIEPEAGLEAICRGRRVDTVEGIDPATLTPYLDSGATQCGACTPGVVMAAEWIRAHPDLLATHSIREMMAGNLCRCTGYDGIVDAIARALADGGPRG